MIDRRVKYSLAVKACARKMEKYSETHKVSSEASTSPNILYLGLRNLNHRRHVAGGGSGGRCNSADSPLTPMTHMGAMPSAQA